MLEGEYVIVIKEGSYFGLLLVVLLSSSIQPSFVQEQ